MEENQPKTGRYALIYGAILGGIGIVFSLMLYFMDLHYQIDLKRIFINLIIGLVFIIVGSIVAMLAFRKANNGFMSLGQGLKIGVGLALISGIIGIIFNFILTELIDPDMTEKAIEYGITVMRDAGMTEDQIQQQVESQKNQNPMWQVAIGLIFSIIMGFIGSLIPALVLKKSENPY